MKTMNIYQKINAVMTEVGGVAKKGFNDYHQYKYAKESDYIEAIRPSLIKHGLVVTPSMESIKKEGDITEVVMMFTVTNVENPAEQIVAKVPGQGADKGDKGVYKAITGAKKYFVANQFLIPTHDDAEGDSSYEKQVERSQTTPNKAAVVKPIPAQNNGVNRSAFKAKTQQPASGNGEAEWI